MARTNDMFLARANADTERPEIWAVRSGGTVIPIAGGDGAAERERRESETARAAAEAKRVSAETARAAAQEKNDADQQLNNEAIRKLSPVVLASGQYDPDTLEPTVAGEPNRMYFVPITAASMGAVSPLADGVAEAVEAGNAYVEWMWLNGAWEQMGTSRLEARPISTDEIDEVASGRAPSGASVLSLTGLTYLWAKLKAAFAALSHKHSAADVTSGTLPVARGGTGSGTAAAALTALGAASATDVAALRDSVSQTLIIQAYVVDWTSTRAVMPYELDVASAQGSRIRWISGAVAGLGSVSSSVNPSGYTAQVVGWGNGKVSLRLGCDAPGPSARCSYRVLVFGTA